MWHFSLIIWNSAQFSAELPYRCRLLYFLAAEKHVSRILLSRIFLFPIFSFFILGPFFPLSFALLSFSIAPYFVSYSNLVLSFSNLVRYFHQKSHYTAFRIKKEIGNCEWLKVAKIHITFNFNLVFFSNHKKLLIERNIVESRVSMFAVF